MGRKHRENRVKQYYLNDYSSGSGSRTLAIVFACILCGLLALGLLVFFLVFK
jgi:hypothetical protein